VIAAWGSTRPACPRPRPPRPAPPGDLPLQCLGVTQAGHAHLGHLAADVGPQPYLPALAIPAGRTPHEHITASPMIVVGGTDG
jgi:hypothetical protein